MVVWSTVCEVVQTLQLSSDRDSRDIVGDLSVCLDGMHVDPEAFSAAERDHGEKILLQQLQNRAGNGPFFIHVNSRLSTALQSLLLPPIGLKWNIMDVMFYDCSLQKCITCCTSLVERS